MLLAKHLRLNQVALIYVFSMFIGCAKDPGERIPDVRVCSTGNICDEDCGYDSKLCEVRCEERSICTATCQEGQVCFFSCGRRATCGFLCEQGRCITGAHEGSNKCTVQESSEVTSDCNAVGL